MLFAPGFSTRDEVTQTSGRGVGLDVVRTVVEDLSGTIEVRSEHGVGTTFVITLPVTLGVLRCLIARVGDERYALPVVRRRWRPSAWPTADRHEVAGVPVLARDGRTLPLVDLGRSPRRPGRPRPAGRRRGAARRRGASCWPGRSTGSRASWSSSSRTSAPSSAGCPRVAGATIDGDGSVAAGARRARARRAPARVRHAGGHAAAPEPAGAGAARVPAARASDRPRVLVVEDSVGVRELQRVILEGAGYDVHHRGRRPGRRRPAGRASRSTWCSPTSRCPAWTGSPSPARIRRTRGWEDVPVVIMTSRGDEADQRAGLDAGASAYLLKSEFDQAELVDTVRRLLVGR